MPVSAVRHGCLAALLAAALALLGAVPAGARPLPPSAHRLCASTSSTGSHPSRYNRTPAGHGPWRVPKDPCNTEGWGLGRDFAVNCAYWAAEKRPDVWVRAVWKYGYSRSAPGAWRIAVDARRAGFPISHHPRAGDIAAWGRNARMGTSAAGVSYVASPGGHVGYVEKVLAHGRIRLSTMGVTKPDGTMLRGGLTEVLHYAKRQTSFIHHLR